MPFVGLSNGQTDYVGRHFDQAPSTSVLRQEFYTKVFFEMPTGVMPVGEGFTRVFREMPTGVMPAGDFVARTGAGVPLGRPSWGQLWPRGVR